LAVSQEQTRREQVFFDDLGAAYHDFLDKMDKASHLSSLGSAHLIEASQILRPQADLAAIIQGALLPFEQNVLAYITVANTERLAFDLTVKSIPAGAAVCYYRKGDPCYPNPDATNTMIPSLTYAIWHVQFKLSGYITKEIEHDPFREPNHVITAELQR
jgi:hypothetical protein